MSTVSTDNVSPALIPRRHLFGNPERTALRLSSDGRWLSYLAPRDGVLNLWIAPSRELSAAKPVTQDTERGIRHYLWAWTDAHLLYLQDSGGDENWHLFVIELSTLRARDLTPVAGVQAVVIKQSPAPPPEIVVGLNDRVAEYHDLYLLNLETGARTLLLENDGFESFVVDDRYRVCFGRLPTTGGGYVLKKREGDGWLEDPFVTVGPEDSLSTFEVGLDAAGETLYLFDSRGRDTAALVALDVHSGDQKVLLADPRADVDQVSSHPTNGRVDMAASTYTRTTWRALQTALRRDLDALGAITAGDVSILDRTHDDRLWAVAADPGDAPRRFYLYDRDAGQATLLFSDRPALEEALLRPLQPVVIPARDGLELVSYLTLPHAGQRPAEPLPLVLYVHGGPWARDRWGLNSVHQWLANRGYAALSVNFRGSTGFGKAFVNAGDREGGGKMHDDLIDAVNWAVAEGIADRARVAIMGGSYGGYAALVGLSFTPEVFAAGVDIVGPSNLQTLLETFPAYWASEIEEMARRIGDPRTEEGRALLRSRSPLARADAICRPLLIAQGANDPRVKRSESDQIVAALAGRGVPVTYLLYPDEGHGFARPENALSFFAVAEAFLAEHLGAGHLGNGHAGGRVEGVDDDFRGAAFERRTGTLP